MEQPDGTFVAWAGPGETIGVDYVGDTPEHAYAAAMFALKRKSGQWVFLPRERNRLRSGRFVIGVRTDQAFWGIAQKVDDEAPAFRDRQDRDGEMW